MSQEGFLFDELSEFKQNLLREVKNVFPKETEKFIKKEASKLAKTARKIAKNDVGTAKGKKKNWIEAKSYHKKFKVGKTYKYSDDLCCRAYNSSPHAHMIEYGHVNVPRGEGRKKGAGRRSGKGGQGVGFTTGKLVFKRAELEFLSEFLDDTENFLFEYFDDTVGK